MNFNVSNGNDPQEGISVPMNIMEGEDPHKETKTNCLHPDRVFLDSCLMTISMAVKMQEWIYVPRVQLKELA